MQHIATALRAAGDLANVAAMLFFGWAANFLKAAGFEHYRMAGGTPSVSRATITALVADPTSALRYGHFLAAWGFFVASAGCAWMLILGLRWNYHFILRLLNR
ncbi:hypothetical protein HFO56_00805 [Rhizobium laguerreae]|uniref:hypothetical protein n=1 Tax=Rhizobium laguerreae TaxID=1076926 RepID=UPI001C90BAA2|nr:hypothetical protein [Rhizobium laguerreae]MBY3150969.1 hypothetical protein [Rhizobium laguerreae]MBY3433152.1 hypothetical protein [Rhizobium laguerreae]